MPPRTPRPGARIRSWSSCWACRERPSSALSSTASRRRSACCGRCATTAGGSSTSRSATGIPRCCSAFRIPAATRDRYTLLEALPRMRDSRAFDDYVQVCETGVPWVAEVTYDMPFGDGYMLGTFVHRTAKLGDGLINFLTDVTEHRRMEAELRNYADVVAHDLSEPIAGITMLVGLLERRAAEPPSPCRPAAAAVERGARARPHRRRARLRARRRAEQRAGQARRAGDPGRRGPPRTARRGGRDARGRASCRRSRATRGSCGACCRTCSRTR